MSFYSSQDIKTSIIDPVYDRTNFKTLFKLDSNTTYLSNMRLLNVGVKVANTPTYNRLVGALGVIKRIRLMDGKTELCSLREANRWLAFNALRHTNSDNECIYQPLIHNAVGSFVDDTQKVATRITQRQIHHLEADTPKGYVDLRSVLPMLNAVQSLPSEMFPNLQLEIEYETDDAKRISSTATAATTVQPILVVDMVVTDKVQRTMLSNFKTASWQEVEHDEFLIDAATAGAAKSTSQRINGFNNKFLTNLLMIKTNASRAQYLNGDDVVADGEYGSLAQHSEKISFRVNGKNILPGAGLDRPNKQLAMLNDTYGKMTTYPASNLLSLGDAAVMNARVDDGSNRRGKEAFTGIFIGDRIFDLQIEHERTGLNNDANPTQTNDQLRVHLFGQVQKSIVVKGAAYNVVYN